MKRVLLNVCLLFTGVVYGWDPDAGLIESFTKLNGVTVTATSGASPEKVIDSNDNTNWVSGHCLPSAYLSRIDVNLLYGACNSSKCTSNGIAQKDLASATDGNAYSAAHVKTNGSFAAFSVTIDNPRMLELISLSGMFTAPTSLYANEQIGTSSVRHLMRTFTSADNYVNINIPGKNFTVNKLELISDSGFTIKDIGAMGQNGCTERITIDLGSSRNVGTIRTRHWAGTNAASKLVMKTSTDGLAWRDVAVLDPNALHAVTTRVTPAVIRFIALEYIVNLKNYNHIYCYEIDAWDENGIWGPNILAKPQTSSFKGILGVNGIWGWGTNKYSDTLNSSQGPKLYSQIASHARNYHNLVWDMTDPDLDPEYTKMAAGKGTQAKWWLNWDTEYRAWNAANLSVDISIQFTNKTVPQSTWNTPEQSAFHYGQEIAKHFGSVHGNGLVKAVEVGNEPWDYDSAFYAEVLKGMSSGLRSMDSKLIIIPGTFQAEDKHHTNTYIGTRVLPEVANNIDVINCHTYSFVNDDSGVRRGTFPENKDSTFNNIRPITRWRDTNTPTKPVWVTEWGWDSDGVGEICRGTECVSEKAQAVYAIRGLLILARSNIERATWYFYANTNCETLFCRSGLTSSIQHNFQKKAVFYTFHDFLQIVGDSFFLGIIQENENGFIYALSDHSQPSLINPSIPDLLGKASYIIGWLPIDISNTTSTSVTFDLPPNIYASKGWRITGNPGGTHSQILSSTDYNQNGQSLTLSLKTEPVILQLNHEEIIVG